MDENLTFFNIAKRNLRHYSMFLVLVGIMLIFGGVTGFVNLRPRNISNIFIQNSYILVLAVGMVLVIITGNIDLSVGSVAAFTGAVSALIYNTGIGFIPTLILTLMVGALIGAFQGAWIAYLKVPAFIVTLAGMLLFRGLTYIISNISPIALADDKYKAIASGYLPDFSHNITIGGTSIHIFTLIITLASIFVFIFYDFISRKKKIAYNFEVLPIRYFILKNSIISLFILYVGIQLALYRGIPNVLILLAVVVALFTFITQKTVIGRYIYAVGGNAKAARLSGINSEKVLFLVYTLMGSLAALSGVVFTAYMNQALPQSGNLFELEAIASVFIGGASAGGGIGTVIGAITGGLVMGVINNGMSLKNLGAEYQYVVKAGVLLLAVWYDIYTRKQSR